MRLCQNDGCRGAYEAYMGFTMACSTRPVAGGGGGEDPLGQRLHRVPYSTKVHIFPK